MLTVVLGVAVVGIAVLAAAVLTGNTILALIVIVIAAVGLVLLARDWLAERRQADSLRAAEDSPDPAEVHASTGTSLDADEFEPDVYDEGDESEPSSQTAKDDSD